MDTLFDIVYPISSVASFWMIVVIGSYFIGDKKRYSPFKQQAIIGLIWGVVLGSVVLPSATIALLLFSLRNETRGGDAAIGAIGFVIIAIPIGFMIGGITGLLFVSIKNYFKNKNK